MASTHTAIARIIASFSPRIDFDCIGLTGPDLSLRNGGARVTVTLNLVFMIHDVSVRTHVGTTVNVDLESVARMVPAIAVPSEEVIPFQVANSADRKIGPERTQPPRARQAPRSRRSASWDGPGSCP